MLRLLPLLLAVAACARTQAPPPERPAWAEPSRDVESSGDVDSQVLDSQVVDAPSPVPRGQCLSAQEVLATAALGDVAPAEREGALSCVEGLEGSACLESLYVWNSESEIVVIKEFQDAGRETLSLAVRVGACWRLLGAVYQHTHEEPREGYSLEYELGEPLGNEEEMRWTLQTRSVQEATGGEYGDDSSSSERTEEIVCRRSDAGETRCGWFLRHARHTMGDPSEEESGDCATSVEERLGRFTQRYSCGENQRPRLWDTETPPDMESLLERGLEGLVR